jgi:hypothetical protein
MLWGGGVGDGRTGALFTSLTRLGAGGGSSLRRDMMLEVFLGSGGRGAAGGA